MNRGSEISGKAAATAGLCRSVCPTASVAPDAAAASIIRSASEIDAAIGFSTSTAGFEQRQADAHVVLRRHRHHDPVDGRLDLANVPDGDGSDVRRDRLCPSRVEIDHRGEIHLRGRRENTGVMPSQVTDADHCRTKRRHLHDDDAPAPTTRPTTATPAALAASNTRPPSSTTVFPASTDSTAAPAAPSASIVATPMTGTSNRMS